MFGKSSSIIFLDNVIKPIWRTCFLFFLITFVGISTATANRVSGAEPTEPKPLTKENLLDQPTDFDSLFNGQDLTGWGYRNKKQGEFVFDSFKGL